MVSSNQNEDQRSQPWKKWVKDELEARRKAAEIADKKESNAAKPKKPNPDEDDEDDEDDDDDFVNKAG